MINALHQAEVQRETILKKVEELDKKIDQIIKILVEDDVVENSYRKRRIKEILAMEPEF
jgi:hypothetical protein